MQRRTLIRAGLAASVVLATAGAAVQLWQPAWRGGRLGERAQTLMRAVGTAVLQGLLPAAAAAHEAALAAWLERLEALIGALPEPTRDEFSQLLSLLLLAPGRRWIAGLEPDWPAATTEQVQQALQAMRTAPALVRQQAYHALRDLTMAAYASGPGTWASLGYPGPAEL